MFVYAMHKKRYIFFYFSINNQQSINHLILSFANPLIKAVTPSRLFVHFSNHFLLEIKAFNVAMYLIDGLVDLGHSLSRQENNISGNFTKAAERVVSAAAPNVTMTTRSFLAKYI